MEEASNGVSGHESGGHRPTLQWSEEPVASPPARRTGIPLWERFAAPKARTTTTRALDAAIPAVEEERTRDKATGTNGHGFVRMMSDGAPHMTGIQLEPYAGAPVGDLPSARPERGQSATPLREDQPWQPSDGVLPASAPRAPSKPPKQSSTIVTIVSIVKAYIGSGVFGLPYAFREGGMVLSPLLLLLISIISNGCVLLLVECKRDLDSRRGAAEPRVQTFGHIGARTFGKVGSGIVNANLVLTQCGFCAVYIIYIGGEEAGCRMPHGAGGRSVLTARDPVQVTTSQTCCRRPSTPTWTRRPSSSA